MICKINSSLHLKTTNKTEISKKIHNKGTPTILTLTISIYSINNQTIPIIKADDNEIMRNILEKINNQIIIKTIKTIFSTKRNPPFMIRENKNIT